MHRILPIVPVAGRKPNLNRFPLGLGYVAVSLATDLSKEEKRRSPCFIPFYDVYIDYNGRTTTTRPREDARRPDQDHA